MISTPNSGLTDCLQRMYALMRQMLGESIGIFTSHDPVIALCCTRIFDLEDGVLEECLC